MDCLSYNIFMQNNTNSKSIKHTLNVIKQALEDKEESQNDSTNNVLILNQLIKEDGTIDIIEDQTIQKKEIKLILENKLSEVFDQKLEQWLDKNLPHYLDKQFLDKNN